MSNAPLFLPGLIKNDKQLWLAMKQGNERAFSIIFNKYYNDLYFYGLKLTSNETLVKDTIQDLFCGIWQRREQLGEVDFIKIYLIKSFRRELMRGAISMQKLLENKLSFKKMQGDFELSQEDLIIECNSKNEHSVKLAQGLLSLKPAQREIIYLRYYNGFDDKEIAQILDIKYQSVRNKLHRALTSLRKKVKV